MQQHPASGGAKRPGGDIGDGVAETARTRMGEDYRNGHKPLQDAPRAAVAETAASCKSAVAKSSVKLDVGVLDTLLVLGAILDEKSGELIRAHFERI